MSGLTATERLTRLLGVIPWVVAHGGVSIDEISTRFDYPRPELLRDLQEVVFLVGVHPFTPDTLIEVVIDDERVWISYADWFARPLRLDAEERLALLTAGRSVLAMSGTDTTGADDPAGGDRGATGEAADNPLLRALAKLVAVTGPVEQTLEIRLGERLGDTLAELRQAVAERRVVELDYYSFGRDERQVRQVEPTRLFSADGRWYLTGWCRSAEDLRVFRVDRVRRATLLDEVVDRPAAGDDDGGAEPSASDSVRDPSLPRITLELAPDDAWVVSAYPYDEAERLDGGRWRVRLPVTTRTWLERLLVRMGPDTRVVDATEGYGPEVGRRAAIRVLARYATDSGGAAARVPGS